MPACPAGTWKALHGDGCDQNDIECYHTSATPMLYGVNSGCFKPEGLTTHSEPDPDPNVMLTPIPKPISALTLIGSRGPKPNPNPNPSPNPDRLSRSKVARRSYRPRPSALPRGLCRR